MVNVPEPVTFIDREPGETIPFKVVLITDAAPAMPAEADGGIGLLLCCNGFLNWSQ